MIIQGNTITSVVIQPIGGGANATKDFFKDNATRWAEKSKYKEKWENSKGAIVLFVKDSKVFAKGYINEINETNDNKYPLDYSYISEPVNYIDYKQIVKIAELSLGNFRIYELLDANVSQKIIEYIDFQVKAITNNRDKQINPNLKEIINNFDKQVTLSLTGNLEERRSRLKEANKKPTEIEVTTKNFVRNPDVVAEVLFCANGVCEKCNQSAPFIRAKDKSPYLEVHHKIHLANGGDDSIENAEALCPNCHRERHYGDVSKNI